MTREQYAAYLIKCFQYASQFCRNPAEDGHTPRSYATFVASEIRRMLAENPNRPTLIPRDEALEFAALLDQGEFDEELNGLMGGM